MNPSDRQPLPFDVVRWTDLTTSDFVAWFGLAVACDAPPDLFPDWSAALIDAHRIPVSEILVLRSADDGLLTSVLPLRIRRQAYGRCLVEPLLNAFALHHGVLTKVPTDEFTISVLECVAKIQGFKWSEFRILRVVENDPWEKAWRQATSVLGLSYRVTFVAQPPFLPISTGWEQFLATQSRNFRSNLKRKENKLSHFGTVTVEFLQGGHEAVDALAEIKSIEADTWKNREGSSLVSREWEWEFYERIVRLFGVHRRILVTLLRVGDRAVAYDLSIIGARRAYCLKTSYREGMRDGSPGLVLRAKLMRWIFENGFKEYDFLGNNDRYKLEWSGLVRREYTVRIFNTRTVRGKAWWVLASLANLVSLSRMRIRGENDQADRTEHVEPIR